MRYATTEGVKTAPAMPMREDPVADFKTNSRDGQENKMRGGM